MCSVARVAALVAALLLVTADGASSQGLRGGPPLAACIGDYRRLCPGVVPDGGRIVTCLNAHAEKLSQACFQALAARGLALTAALRLCRGDYERLCAGVPVGGGQALACLQDNRNRLSPACRNALAAHGFETGGEDE